MSDAFRRQEALRRADREAQRREEARQQRLDEQREREQEAAREEARVEEARAQARDEEAARAREEERVAQRREQLRTQRRLDARAERRATERQQSRRLEVRDALKALAASDARAAQRRDADRQQRRAEAKREQGTADRQVADREERRAGDRNVQRAVDRREAAREERRADARAAERQDTAREQRRSDSRAAERHDTAHEQRRTDNREQQRTAQRADAGREQRQAQSREEQRAAERADAGREQRQAQSREAQREAQRAAEREDAARTQRREDARAQDRAARRRAETLQAARIRDAGVDEAGRPGPARLPSGTISAGLPWLRIARGLVLDEGERPVVLRGVTVRALERARPVGETFAPALSDAEAALMADWGATAVRVTIAQDLALQGAGDAEAEDYREALDATIATAADAGMYTVITLGLVSALATAPPLPDPMSLDLWAVLAQRWSSEPAVLFDLFADPHDPVAGDPTASLLPQVTWPVWRSWLLAMIGELRRRHPRALAIARGLDHGSDLTGFPLRESDGTRAANVLYVAAVGSDGDPEQLLDVLARLGREEAVGLMPWAATAHGQRRAEAIAQRLAAGGRHWTAGDWRGGAAPLVAISDGRLAPTPLGRAVSSALSRPPVPAVPLPAAPAPGEPGHDGWLDAIA